MAVGSYRKIHRIILTTTMGLDINEIKKEVQAPKKRATIQRAITHQNRIKFHAQTRIVPFISQPITDFLLWVDSLIPHYKAKIFKQLFRYPVATNEVTGICFDRLSRIFDGRNPAFNYQFMTTEQRDDWEYYRQDVLKEPNVWNQQGWDIFKTEHNSVLIVDLPKEQDPADHYPQPYFYWLRMENVITYEVDKKTGNMEWIIFRQHDKKIAVFDDEYYRVYEEKDAGQLGELLVENKHDLGYCPARFFWNEPLNLQEPDIKAHPLSKMLSALDWYLFYHTSKKHLDMYGSYPIYSGYEQSCDYHNDETGDECDGGFLKDRSGHYKLDLTGQLVRCPKCGDKRIVGVGSFVEVPIPQENQPDLRNPVQMLTVDRQGLDYNVEEQTRLKTEIITSVCGVDGDVMQTEAVNEKQIDANFENQSTILNRVKKGFEDAQNFVDSTICKLRYGNLFVSAKINLGTEFYTTTPAELRKQYKDAKDGGASEAELDNLQTQILETEYRHNPTQLQRMLILAELEPYRHLTRAEVMDLYSKQLITEDELVVKLNFSNFVRRFERENTNVLEFGTQIPYSKKIEVLTNKFLDYANERRKGR